MISLTRFARAGFLLTALGVAACAAPSWKDASYNEDALAHYPIAVTPEMRSLRIPYHGAEGLTETAAGQLKPFLRDYVNHGNGTLSVTAPRGSEAASQALADAIVAMGVSRGNVLIATDDVAPPGADVRVSYISYVTETKPCGDWSDNLSQTETNMPMPNLGCATQQNIAAMIADPRDLIAPEPIGPADAQRGLTILDKYRKGEATPAAKTEEQSGAVSEVGKN